MAQKKISEWKVSNFLINFKIRKPESAKGDTIYILVKIKPMIVGLYMPYGRPNSWMLEAERLASFKDEYGIGGVYSGDVNLEPLFLVKNQIGHDFVRCSIKQICLNYCRLSKHLFIKSTRSASRQAVSSLENGIHVISVNCGKLLSHRTMPLEKS